MQSFKSEYFYIVLRRHLNYIPSSETSSFIISLFDLAMVSAKFDVETTRGSNGTSLPSIGPKRQDFGIIFFANTPLLSVETSDALFDEVERIEIFFVMALIER